jgi:hypothetical protein
LKGSISFYVAAKATKSSRCHEDGSFEYRPPHRETLRNQLDEYHFLSSGVIETVGVQAVNP